MHAWQTTRNTFEAAALAALDIPVKPVTMTDRKTGTTYTDWNLAPASTVDPARNGRPYLTGLIRKDFGSGKQLTGDLATQPLHPFLIGIRTFINRGRLIESHKGGCYRLKEDAHGSYLLERSQQSVNPVTEVTFQSPDQDLILALIGTGHELLNTAHDGNVHVYIVSRYARAGTLEPMATRQDCQPLIHELRSNAFFPARRWEPFGVAIHSLHTLREMRKHQQSPEWFTVAHKTYRDKGAAFRVDAPSHTLAQVQHRLGIKI